MSDDFNFDLETPLITLSETTVNRLNGERVGCGNILTRTYQLANGEQQEGLSITLIPASTDEELVVGLGSVFRIGDTKWRVVSLHPKSPEQHLGKVVVEQVF